MKNKRSAQKTEPKKKLGIQSTGDHMLMLSEGDFKIALTIQETQGSGGQQK